MAPENHVPGKVLHTMGWPGNHFGGLFTGSYLYHLENNQVSLGLIVDLSYSNPHISPFDEFQRFKHHPLIADVLEGGPVRGIIQDPVTRKRGQRIGRWREREPLPGAIECQALAIEVDPLKCSTSPGVGKRATSGAGFANSY